MTRPSFNAAGRTREAKMPADARFACQEPATRDIFDMVIDAYDHKPDTQRLRAATRMAKRVCQGCAYRVECFIVHGADLELGVVAGLTDAERAKKLGAA